MVARPSRAAALLTFLLLATTAAGEQLYWYSTFFHPEKPEAGGKQQYSIFITNGLNTTIPKGGMKVSIWANKTEIAGCNEGGPTAEYDLPDIKPLATYELKVSYKVGDALGPIVTRVFVDSGCQVGTNPDNQRTRELVVVEKGAAYTAVDTEFRSPEFYPWGVLDFPSAIRFMTPTYPVAGSAFSAQITVTNLALTPLEAGATMEVWAEVPGHGFTCGEKGDVSVTLPKLGPGKSKAIDVEGLIAPDLVQADLVTAVFAPNCQPGSAPLSKRTYAYQPLAKTVPVLIGARNVKNQYTFKLKTTPSKPKANSTMTVKFKVQNAGPVDGPVGSVAIWISPPGDSFGGYTNGAPCAYEGFAASADFPDLIVKPGKSARIKVEGVPVPAAPGFWAVTALPDAQCTSGGDAVALLYKMPAYAVVEVV